MWKDVISAEWSYSYKHLKKNKVLIYSYYNFGYNLVNFYFNNLFGDNKISPYKVCKVLYFYFL